MTASRLRHPVIFLSLALLILNDHVLKGSIVSGFLTGKLSDFAGLFFFPFFVADCLQIYDRRIFDVSAVLIALAFVALKCSPMFLLLFMGAYDAFGLKAVVVQDPTDLWALTMLPLASALERALFSDNPQHGVRYEEKI